MKSKAIKQKTKMASKKRSSKPKHEWLQVVSFLAFLFIFGSMAGMVACTSTPPTQAEIEASIYKLYKTSPEAINQTGANGRTPLYEAVKYNDMDAIRLFLKNPKINIYTKPSALTRATFNGNLEVVQLLLSKGARVNNVNHSGETALHIASRKKYKDIVRALLGAGAEVNIQDKRGSTPLMKAALKGDVEIVNTLIQAGSDLNIRNKFDRTALIYATAKNHEQLALGLIQPGVDLNQKDKKGKNALIYSAQNGNVAIVKKLIQAGATIDLQGKDKSALERAAMNGHTEIVKSLIQANYQKRTVKD